MKVIELKAGADNRFLGGARDLNRMSSISDSAHPGLYPQMLLLIAVAVAEFDSHTPQLSVTDCSKARSPQLSCWPGAAAFSQHFINFGRLLFRSIIEPSGTVGAPHTLE